jgi:predicted MFS family arabinose efflux permease
MVTMRARLSQGEFALPSLLLLACAYGYSTVIMAPLLVAIAHDLGVTVGGAGLAVAAYLVPTVVLGVVIGPYSDRLGRKPFLVIGMIVLGLATIGAALAPTFEVLVAFRLASGVGGALCASSLIAALADVVPYERRASAIGLVNTTTNVFVGVAGVPIAGILAEATSWRVSIALVGVVALCVAAAVAVSLPPSGRGTAGVRRLYALVFGDRSALLLLGVALVAGFAWVGWSTYVVVFFQRTYGLPQGLASTFAISTGVGYLIGGRLGGRIGDRIGNRTVALVALLAAAAAFIVMTEVPLPLAGAAVMNAVLVALLAARIVAVQTMLSEQVPAARATLGALMGSANAAAASGGAAIAGLAIDAGGFPLFGVIAAALVVAAALLLAPVRARAAPAPLGSLLKE